MSRGRPGSRRRTHRDRRARRGVDAAVAACRHWPARQLRAAATSSSITIDTLRADRVGAFGSTRGLTPRLDRLGAEGLRFTRAYTSAPLTLPAHASLLTSVSPPVHGVRNNSLFRLGDNLPTLATVLEGGRVPDGRVRRRLRPRRALRPEPRLRRLRRSLRRKGAGDPAKDAERRAEDVIAPAAAWILGRTSAQLPAPRPQPLPAPAPSPWSLLRGSPGSTSTTPTLPTARQSRSLRGTSRTTARSPTRTRWSARCSIVCSAAGQLERTLIVFTADHGESLGEHGEATHGVFVYESTMKVPALVWAGNRIGGRVVRRADAAGRSRADRGRSARRRRFRRHSKDARCSRQSTPARPTRRRRQPTSRRWTRT